MLLPFRSFITNHQTIKFPFLSAQVVIFKLFNKGFLKSDSHVPEKFCQIKVISNGVQKNSIICLVFENENK